MFYPSYQENKEYDIHVAAKRKEVIDMSIKKNWKDLGPLSFGENLLILCFLFCALNCIFMSPGFFDGWGNYISKKYSLPSNAKKLVVSDATPAILTMILLFVLPSKVSECKFSNMFLYAITQGFIHKFN